MSKKIFEPLTPNNKIELKGYSEALDFAFDSDKIKNVALAGGYSSGKSSIMETYEKQHSEKTIIHLSLAHFSGNTQEKETANKDESKVGTTNKAPSSEAILEGKIINQLIQQLSPKKIELTNFNTKRETPKKTHILYGIAIPLLVLSFLHIWQFEEWKAYVRLIEINWLRRILSMSTFSFSCIVSGLVLFLALGLVVYNLVRIQYSKHLFRKISLKGSEIEIFSDSDDSLFDKYLNEVLYLFEKSGAHAVVFDDIDRFDNLLFFERLREINTLVNKRFEEKYSSDNSKKKKLEKMMFIYLIKDEIFNNSSDRTKFFDFIIPVMPYLDSANSYDLILEYIVKHDIHDSFDKDFLRGISLYIDDPRLLTNIFNEYLVFKDRVENLEPKANKLFAIVTYKNLFPQDYADLRVGKGYLYDLIRNVDRVKNLILEAYDKENKEVFKDNSNQIINELGLVSFFKRAILDDEKNTWRDNVEKAVLSELLGLIGFDRYYKLFCYVTDETIGAEKLEKRAEKETAELAEKYNVELKKFRTLPNSGLIVFLLSGGYIDEYYSDYTSHFYPNSITGNDKLYVKSVKERQQEDSFYHLDSPSNVMDYLTVYDFQYPETINYDLLDYLFTKKTIHPKKPASISYIIQQFEEDEDEYELFSGYLLNGKQVDSAIGVIIKEWVDVFYAMVESGSVSDEKLLILSYKLLANVDADNLSKVNQEDCLSDFISQRKDYLHYEENSSQIGKALCLLKVKFPEVDEKTANRDLLDCVYENNMYEINATNIKMMLKLYAGIENISQLFDKFFTYVSENRAIKICNYMWANLDLTLNAYLEMYSGSIYDSSDVIVDVLNEGLSVPEKYVSKISTKIDDVDLITDYGLYDVLLDNMVISSSLHNVLSCYKENGLNGSLVDFINSSEIDWGEALSSDEEDAFYSFIDESIDNLEINDNKVIGLIQSNGGKESIEINNEEVVFPNGRMELLIENHFLKMTTVSLKYVREKYKSLLINYILEYIDEYITLKKPDILLEEVEGVIASDRVSIEQKKELLKQYSRPISLINHSYSDDVCIYILNNHLETNDIPWLAENYANLSDLLKNEVVNVSGTHFQLITDPKTKVSKELYLDLFAYVKISLKDKLTLLKIRLNEHVSMEELKLILLAMKADKIADNIDDGRKQIEYNQENLGIVDCLYNAGIIYSPELNKDKKHYSKLKVNQKYFSNDDKSSGIAVN